MKKKKNNRIIAMLLVITLLLSAMSFLVYADSNSKAKVSIIVSNYTNADNYGFNSLSTIKKSSINSSAAKGDKIAISFILSEVNNNTLNYIQYLELKGTWNSNLMVPGYYQNNRTEDTWVAQTTEDSTSDSAIIANTPTILNNNQWINGHSFLDMNDSAIQLAFYEKNTSPTIPDTTTFHDANTNKDITINGAVIFTVGFEAIQNIDDINDVFTWDNDDTFITVNNVDYKINTGKIIFDNTDWCNHDDNNENVLENEENGLYCSVCGEELIAPVIPDDYLNVMIPKNIILDGSSTNENTGTYSVKINGKVSKINNVSVAPSTNNTTVIQQGDPLDENKVQFYMGQTGHKDIIATINQNKTIFSSVDINSSDSKLNTTTGTVSVDNLTAGSWNGVFYFNIKASSTPDITKYGQSEGDEAINITE